MATHEHEASATLNPYRHSVTVTCAHCQQQVPVGLPDNNVEMAIFCQNCEEEVPIVSVLAANLVLARVEIRELGNAIGMFISVVSAVSKDRQNMNGDLLHAALTHAATLIRATAEMPATLHFCHAVERTSNGAN